MVLWPPIASLLFISIRLNKDFLKRLKSHNIKIMVDKMLIVEITIYCLLNDKKALKMFGLRTWCTKEPHAYKVSYELLDIVFFCHLNL